MKGSEHLLLDSGFAAHLAHMLDIPSLSPAVTERAADVATAVETELKKIQDLVPDQELQILKRYAEALRFIAEVGFFQSRFLIEYLRQEMVDRPRAGRLGVTLEQLPMTVQLLKLARKNSDGTPWVEGEAWR
ncbi:hypothetical protein SAMN00790413_05216 [Deinococcus hopiensis KR-140]|uniref:Uncharacterized protein n=2 Tax=Deinococcus TaxID=1298 RepID=A0A1W1UU42_9DEIO|nr:hypothetical protein SAMN00790413_05216 [Deinococcus hopiensis KR-140]